MADDNTATASSQPTMPEGRQRLFRLAGLVLTGAGVLLQLFWLRSWGQLLGHGICFIGLALCAIAHDRSPAWSLYAVIPLVGPAVPITELTLQREAKPHSAALWASGLMLILLGTVLFEVSLLPGVFPDIPASAPMVVLLIMLPCVGLAVYADAYRRRGGIAVFGMLPFVGVYIGLLVLPYYSRVKPGREWWSRISALFGLGVIGLLVWIAIANWVLIQARSRMGEAMKGLGELRTAAMSRAAESNSYIVSSMNDLSIEKIQPFRYSFWYAVNGSPHAIPQSPRLQWPCDLTTPPASARVTASATGFIAAAKGNLDPDATCDEWTINSRGELFHVVDDLKQ